MTCQYTDTQWRDSLYNSIRATSGGVAGAAAFLTSRRDTSIHKESLRRKLTGDEQLDVDVAILLSEYIANDAKASERSHDWLLCVNAQEGLHVDHVPAAPVDGHPDEARALQDKFLALSAKIGKIAGVTAQTTEDAKIELEEADELVPLLRAARVMLHRMERNVLRAASK